MVGNEREGRTKGRTAIRPNLVKIFKIQLSKGPISKPVQLEQYPTESVAFSTKNVQPAQGWQWAWVQLLSIMGIRLYRVHYRGVMQKLAGGLFLQAQPHIIFGEHPTSPAVYFYRRSPTSQKRRKNNLQFRKQYSTCNCHNFFFVAKVQLFSIDRKRNQYIRGRRYKPSTHPTIFWTKSCTTEQPSLQKLIACHHIKTLYTAPKGVRKSREGEEKHAQW